MHELDSSEIAAAHLAIDGHAERLEGLVSELKQLDARLRYALARSSQCGDKHPRASIYVRGVRDTLSRIEAITEILNE